MENKEAKLESAPAYDGGKCYYVYQLPQGENVN